MAWVASMAVDVAVVPDGRDAQMMSEKPRLRFVPPLSATIARPWF